MKITYKEAKQRARKERDIWVRRLLCDPITTPLAYLLARYPIVDPKGVTYITFVMGMIAALMFINNNLAAGALFYASSFLLDSLDGKLNRVLGNDDTYRGMVDFLLDGIVCFSITLSLALTSQSFFIASLFLFWMSLHYLDMRYTSATYRLKLQARDTNTWIVNEDSKGPLKHVYKFIKKTGTYPIPSVGEAVVLMFIVGPLLWYFTGNVAFQGLMVVLGILCTLPETIGAGMIAYKKVKEMK